LVYDQRRGGQALFGLFKLILYHIVDQGKMAINLLLRSIILKCYCDKEGPGDDEHHTTMNTINRLTARFMKNG